MSNALRKKIASKEAVIGVIGLGYIGLSLLDVFGKAGFSLVGYDKSKEKVQMLKKKDSYINYLSLDFLFNLLSKKKFTPSADSDILKKADVLVISVPTSLDKHHVPELSNLRAAFQTVISYLKKDQLVVVQSSTYPGTTEDELLPLLKKSQLKVGKDFYLAHVPEIADIGNPSYNFIDVPRMVSGITPTCLKMAELLYESIGATVVPCSCPKVAESAKLLQNTYRLVNISLINEMKIMLDRMGIDIWEVVEAASSKPFGFTPFYPGPGIGGDCIPIDPFYLVWRAKASGGPTTLIEQSGNIDDGMAIYVVNKVIQGLNTREKSIRGAKTLVLGVGYKKDVNDIRQSPGLRVLSILKSMLADVHYHDPFVPEIASLPEFPELHLKSIHFKYDQLPQYDAVIIVTDHSFYDWDRIVDSSQLIIDTRNVTAKIPGAKGKVVKA